MKCFNLVYVTLIIFVLAVSGYAISRDSVMDIAYSYTTATWYCIPGNANPEWNRYTVGNWYTGVPYNMGGWDSLSTCFYKLSTGTIAGNALKSSVNTHTPDHVGVDCSGLVTNCWGLNTATTKYYTWTLPDVSNEIDWSDLVRGDIFVKSGTHVCLFDYFTNSTTEMMIYESTYIDVSPGRVIHHIVPRTFFPNYIPRRFNGIEELPYPYSPYQDLDLYSTTMQQPWIIGGLGSVGAISWKKVCATNPVSNIAAAEQKSYIAQLNQSNWGTGYAYTGSSTDTDYTVEAYVWCRYSSDTADYAIRSNQLLAYFKPIPMQYLRLYSDFASGTERQQLVLDACDSTGTKTVLGTWHYPTDFPDPKSSGWHYFRLSILDGVVKVWFDGKRLTDPVGKYQGLNSGYVACSQYSNDSGIQQTGWFADLKVYPTTILERSK